jgi:hypothetical protein
MFETLPARSQNTDVENLNNMLITRVDNLSNLFVYLLNHRW